MWTWTVRTHAEGWTEHERIKGKGGKGQSEREKRGIWRPSEPCCILSRWLTRPRWFLLTLYYVVVRYDSPQCADAAVCMWDLKKKKHHMIWWVAHDGRSRIKGTLQPNMKCTQISCTNKVWETKHSVIRNFVIEKHLAFYCESFYFDHLQDLMYVSYSCNCRHVYPFKLDLFCYFCHVFITHTSFLLFSPCLSLVISTYFWSRQPFHPLT